MESSSNNAPPKRPANKRHLPQSRRKNTDTKGPKPFKLNADNPAGIREELVRQRTLAAQTKELRLRALKHDLKLLTAQISKVKFDITHGSRTTLKTMEHRNPSASVDEQLNRELARLQKQAKVIATALRRDDIKGVRDMIQAVDVLFSQQKAQRLVAQHQAVAAVKAQMAVTKRAYLLNSEDSTCKHDKPWRPSGREERSTVPTMAMKPNPGGKPFNLAGKEIWPVLKQGNGWGPARNKPAPWRQVTSGRTFGEAPLNSLGREQRKWLLKRKHEHADIAKRKEDQVRQAYKLAHSESTNTVDRPPVWKCSPATPGKLFAKCKPNKPLTYYERIKAMMMCQPDRVMYRESDDGKPPWLPTRTGELFQSTCPVPPAAVAAHGSAFKH